MLYAEGNASQGGFFQNSNFLTYKTKLRETTRLRDRLVRAAKQGNLMRFPQYPLQQPVVLCIRVLQPWQALAQHSKQATPVIRRTRYSRTWKGLVKLCL